MNIRKTIGALAALGLAIAFVPAALAQVGPPATAREGAFPYQNGSLAALAMFIPESQASEFEKPSDEAPTVSLIHSLNVGETAALKVIFKGPQRDAEGRVDVTFDVDFVGPDGKILIGGSLKDLPAVQGSVDVPDAVFDNILAVPRIGFDATDPKGVYKALIVLHDKIGGRDIPMTIEIERL